MERNDRLIRKKIYKYMFTSVLTTVALQLGNVVDAMIVGNLIGSTANAAVSAALPFVYILQIAALLTGTGGAVTIAVLLGKRRAEDAGRVMGFAMLVSLVYPLIFMILTPVTVPAFLKIMKISGELSGMVRSITTVYSFGMPIISFVIAMTYMINVDSHPTLSSSMLIVSNVVNLACDFILVKFTSLGVTGSTLSTVIGYAVGGIIFLPKYFKSRNRMVKPSLHGLRENNVMLLTCRNGLPNTVNMIMTIIKVFVINSAVLRLLGNNMFTVFSVANHTQQITQMFLNGVTSVTASVAGVLCGEKDFFGMRSVLKRVFVIGLSVGVAITALFLAFPQILADLYGFKNEELRPELFAVLRIFSLSFVFFVLNSIVQNYYKVIGHRALSSLDSVFELVVFCIPLSLYGMERYGIRGLFYAFILNEILSFAVINIIRIIMQKTGKMYNGGFMAVPRENEGNICDITVSGDDRNAVEASKAIEKYCLEIGLSEEKSRLLRLAAEEIIANIAEHGYTSNADDTKNIDICLSRTDNKLYLRFRDDGVPFDPTAYESEKDGEYIHGLDLLKKTSLKMTYMRVISLNNTIFEIDS
ncbi:MAG: ATP-binding protein [Ruminococcus sp.]|nr:ATP-binding protein [Ruminococcus sp.]